MVATRCCTRAGGGLAVTMTHRGYAGLPAPSGAAAGAARGLFVARQLRGGLTPQPVTNSPQTHHTTAGGVTGWWWVSDGFRGVFSQVEEMCDGCGGFLQHCPTIAFSSSKTPGRVFRAFSNSRVWRLCRKNPPNPSHVDAQLPPAVAHRGAALRPRFGEYAVVRTTEYGIGALSDASFR